MLLGYARVSTGEQAAEDKSSLETQEKIIRGYAMAKGFKPEACRKGSFETYLVATGFRKD